MGCCARPLTAMACAAAHLTKAELAIRENAEAIKAKKLKDPNFMLPKSRVPPPLPCL